MTRLPHLTTLVASLVLSWATHGQLFPGSSSAWAADSTNTILRQDFNFGHQLGYMYSRMDEAWFYPSGTWRITTGFLAFHTPSMPQVRNPEWKQRTILMIPLYLEVFPCSSIALQAEITDLFIEFPWIDNTSMGGKSPRFKTMVSVLRERQVLPALAFTVGVKFSSAKPYTIWRNDHNYDESNGIAGAGTGVADYLLLFTASKHLAGQLTMHARIGLAPLGSPVEYTRGSAQADEIPYGVSFQKVWNESWMTQTEVCGMYNGLASTRLAHYSVARFQVHRTCRDFRFTVDMERGLTPESDTWVGGIYCRYNGSVRKPR